VTAGHTICDFQIHLIRTPSCMLRPTLAQPTDDQATPHSHVRDHALSLNEKIFDLCEAQHEPATKPDRPPHVFGWTPLSVVADFLLALANEMLGEHKSETTRQHAHCSVFAMIVISAPRARARRDITVPAGSPSLRRSRDYNV
jgi:hypothetical protein